MKSNFWLLTAAVLMILCSAGKATAQGCSVSYQPDFSVYTNETTDGTYLYTQVGIDGSGEMTESGIVPAFQISSIHPMRQPR